MNTRITGLVLLAIGVVLLVLSAGASDSLTSFFSQLFQGTPSSKTILLLVGGALAAALGVVQLARPAR